MHTTLLDERPVRLWRSGLRHRRLPTVKKTWCPTAIRHVWTVPTTPAKPDADLAEAGSGNTDDPPNANPHGVNDANVESQGGCQVAGRAEPIGAAWWLALLLLLLARARQEPASTSRVHATLSTCGMQSHVSANRWAAS
jgi:MYXO-CTERM domain-containing protein